MQLLTNEQLITVNRRRLDDLRAKPGKTNEDLRECDQARDDLRRLLAARQRHLEEELGWVISELEALRH